MDLTLLCSTLLTGQSRANIEHVKFSYANVEIVANCFYLMNSYFSQDPCPVILIQLFTFLKIPL